MAPYEPNKLIAARPQAAASQASAFVGRPHHPYHTFPITHWSLVRRAGLPVGEARRAALAELLNQYAPALRSFLCTVRRMPADDAEDLLQAFITDRLLEHELFCRAHQGRGRFRSFLLTSLRNYAVSRYRAQRVRATRPLDSSHAVGGDSVAANVEAAWARALVNQVIATMRDECLRRGRQDVWAVFEGRVLAEVFGDRDLVSYEVLAKTLALGSPLEAANLLVTAKRTYARLLRAAIARYESDRVAVETEIADLRRALAAAPAPEN